jgi:hypothetical protein
LKGHALEWWMAQKNALPNLMRILLWSVFKVKLNNRFTPHNKILKDGQELLSLHECNGLGAMGRYVQTFTSLLNFIMMKEEYAYKVTFFHRLQP